MKVKNTKVKKEIKTMHHTILQCNKCSRAFIFNPDERVDCCGKIFIAETICPTYCKEEHHIDNKKIHEGLKRRNYITSVYDLIV
jgi:hypothetical protein